MCFGIIDILQGFTLRKTLERGWKSMLHDGYAISVAPPQLYARRFVDFITTHLFDSIPAAMAPLSPQLSLPSLQEQEAENAAGPITTE